MTELIKQRLVGMLIVVIAGVIFIPDLLDGKKELVKEEFKKIPAKPIVENKPSFSDFPAEKVKTELAKVALQSSEQPEDTIEVSTQEQKTLAENENINGNSSENSSVSEAAQTKSEVNTLSETSTQEQSSIVQQQLNTANTVQDTFSQTAWVLRLGTFRNKPNVDALMSKLEEAGVTPFVKPVEAKAGLLYRVFVGPELDKTKLEAAQKTLKELTGLEGKITEFHVVN